MISMMRIVREADRPLVPWRNGKGQTRDIATAMDGTGALAWQVGLAELTEDAEFSDFGGCDRLFTPLHPVELRFEDGPWQPCPALLPVAFAGDRRTRLRLPHGPSRAFNVITARVWGRARVGAVQLSPGSRMPVSFAGSCALHCVEGQVRLPNDKALGPGDTAQAEPGWQGSLTAPDGARLLLAEIVRAG